MRGEEKAKSDVSVARRRSPHPHTSLLTIYSPLILAPHYLLTPQHRSSPQPSGHERLSRPAGISTMARDAADPRVHSVSRRQFRELRRVHCFYQLSHHARGLFAAEAVARPLIRHVAI